VRDDKHGPLPYVLMLLTFVTGVVDAVSYLKLDHVFVANMTGNVVFLGFAIADAQRFSIGGSLTAIVAFMVGALIGGRVVTHFGDHRGRLLATALYIEIALAAVALAIVALLWNGETGVFSYALILVLAAAMGLQNASARGVGVPDLSTTVLTSLLSSLVADSTLAGRGHPHSGRRVLAVVAMFAGAAVGALLSLHVGVAAALVLVLGLLIAAGVMAQRLAASDATWTVTPLRVP
jgi:uncharacterized membrane protein YoaK (UPF0700 family)